MRPSLHDIVNGLTAAHGFAEVYGEDRPKHAKAIQKFQKQIARAYRELVVAIHPEMKESKKRQKNKRG